MDFCITITSYRREKHLKNLLRQIEAQKGKYNIKCIIFLDGCHYHIDYPSWCEVHEVPHHGRRNWFKMINVMWKYVKRHHFLYYYSLQDDITLTDDFFKKTVRLWKSIKDPQKITLDLRADERSGKPLWGNYEVTKMGNVYLTRWVDMIFMADNFFFEHVGPLEYRNMPSSSGVARQVTKRFRKKGYNMYQVVDTMIHHGHIESLMNPEIRKKEKLKC